MVKTTIIKKCDKHYYNYGKRTEYNMENSHNSETIDIQIIEYEKLIAKKSKTEKQETQNQKE